MYQNIRFSSGRFGWPDTFASFEVGAKLQISGYETGRITLLYKEPTFIIIREDGSRYFNGIGFPQAWASPAIIVLTHCDSRLDAFDEVERIELHHGMKWRSLAKSLFEKYEQMQKA